MALRHHSAFTAPPLYRELRALSQRPYYTPRGLEKRLSADTIRLWLWRYKKLGLAGLRNKLRKIKPKADPICTHRGVGYSLIPDA